MASRFQIERATYSLDDQHNRRIEVARHAGMLVVDGSYLGSDGKRHVVRLFNGCLEHVDIHLLVREVCRKLDVHELATRALADFYAELTRFID